MSGKLTAEELAEIKRRLGILPIDEDWANETEQWVLANGPRLLAHIEALEGALREARERAVEYAREFELGKAGSAGVCLAEAYYRARRDEDALRAENARLREQVGALEAVLECHACGRTHLHSSSRRLDYHTPPRADDKGLRDLVKQVVTELPAPPDPRLANLPDDFRAVAEEFLTLHGAWDMEFEVEVFLRGFGLEWISPNEEDPQCVDWSFRFYPDNAWRLTWCDSEIDSELICRPESPDSKLRRSYDFAEFVARFRVGSDATP